MTGSELKRKYVEFFLSKGHAHISGASLIPENDPTVLFTTAGMHPLVPYILGEPHPAGRRQPRTSQRPDPGWHADAALLPPARADLPESARDGRSVVVTQCDIGAHVHDLAGNGVRQPCGPGDRRERPSKERIQSLLASSMGSPSPGVSRCEVTRTPARLPSVSMPASRWIGPL
mgnify:CR=1 FL=1